ncbi:aminotransferase class I/II-fold pyridoxal phosphate-dependent enzyme [Mycobacterium sp. Y57]|uniref:pyridoxal phosphate-dependent aminotransferase n=1 Tax=Mycolicibacterium xanthum TaxID=2796469 RepID=UPI001C85E4C9|nr:aminotransferase class I/II-fold pyridoxal phosphate-dependent enzyme [Mycolicibacterium xanthum]MBX7432424.1 aminotransferase class I/II-fold pyridoxal phosphate-dependent enzyme [Mycolicibacterium xanthum]
MTVAIPFGRADGASPPWLPDAEDPMALALNENPFPPLPAVRAAIVRAVDSVNRYPEFLPEQFRRLIGEHLGVAEEQIIVGAGATGVVMHVLRALTRPGDRIVMATPTFDGYPVFAQMARLQPVTVPLTEHGHHDLDAMADAATEAQVVVVCRPHNPTGTVESADDVEGFLRRVAHSAVVLLDEAYIEFVSPRYRIDTNALLRCFPNVVVVRTFSKAYGLAGMRIGYGICSPDMARTLWSMQLPFGATLTSLAAVAASFDAEAQLRHRIGRITAERDYLRSRLRDMGIWSTDTHANFVYLPAGNQLWTEVFDGTRPRVRTYPDGSVRITAGTRQSTQTVLAAIAVAQSPDAR